MTRRWKHGTALPTVRAICRWRPCLVPGWPWSSADMELRRIRSNAPFVRAHQQLAALSTVGQQRIVPESSHTIPLDQPEAIVAAIEEVLRDIAQMPAAPRH